MNNNEWTILSPDLSNYPEDIGLFIFEGWEDNMWKDFGGHPSKEAAIGGSAAGIYVWRFKKKPWAKSLFNFAREMANAYYGNYYGADYGSYVDGFEEGFKAARDPENADVLIDY